MSWHPFTLTVDTPCFLGQEPTGLTNTGDSTLPTDRRAPFPVASLRGVLRYWLRALAGAHVDDSETLYRLESRVFGRAASDRGEPDTTRDEEAPSPIALRAKRHATFSHDETPPWLGADHVPYLLGLGLARHDRNKHRFVLQRRFLETGTAVSLEVRLRHQTGGSGQTTALGDLFLAALWATRTFGGLGARTRRGFGSVTVTMPDGVPHTAFRPEWFTRDRTDVLPEVLTSVEAAMGALGIQSARPTGLPAFPCFRPDHYLLGVDRPLRAVDVGRALQVTSELYHHFRRDGETTTVDWDEIIEPYLSGQEMSDDAFVENAALGLPIGYQQKDTRKRAVVNCGNNRRASPLWLRIRPGATGADTVVPRRTGWSLRALAFTSEFLPGIGDPPKLTITGGWRTVQVNGPTQTQVENYLATAVEFLITKTIPRR